MNFLKDKLVESLCRLSLICTNMKSSGKIVVLTSGCFDLLHGGHLEYLESASQWGNLIVGINSDQFVKRLKGDTRPIRDEQDRAFLISGFSAVEFVTIFDCDYRLIEAVKPDIYIASVTSHLKIEDDVKRIELLESFGTRIVELESGKRDSTTDIIRRAATT
ncbi:MAG: adenylyltransferase/cytidyltransferase family protein [Candidatus Moranbacteria bacterium]|nr:adenylyltransferase/cytidyltransferase family protein [Candidatus Moranbacteria bacterium]